MRRKLPLHRRKKVHPGPMTRAEKRRFHERRKQKRKRQQRSQRRIELCEIQFPGVYVAPTGETIRTVKRIRPKFHL